MIVHRLAENYCYPWIGENGKCKLRKKATLRDAGCEPKNPFRKGLYTVGPAYRLGNETDIMQEIIYSGPVQGKKKKKNKRKILEIFLQ